MQTIDLQATITADPQPKLVQIESMLPDIMLITQMLEAGYPIGK
jgi:hypothetical protein